MIKIEENKSSKLASKDVKDVLVNNTFTGIIGVVSGLFLRIHEGVVLLNNANKTWMFYGEGGRNPIVENYVEVECKLTYEVKKSVDDGF